MQKSRPPPPHIFFYFTHIGEVLLRSIVPYYRVGECKYVLCSIMWGEPPPDFFDVFMHFIYLLFLFIIAKASVHIMNTLLSCLMRPSYSSVAVRLHSNNSNNSNMRLLYNTSANLLLLGINTIVSGWYYYESMWEITWNLCRIMLY